MVVCCSVTKLYPTLFNPMDCSLPGSFVHGPLQARIVEWVAMSFSLGSPPPWGWTQAFCIAERLFTIWATKEANYLFKDFISNYGHILRYSRLGLQTKKWSRHKSVQNSVYIQVAIQICAKVVWSKHLGDQNATVIWNKVYEISIQHSTCLSHQNQHFQI